MPTLDLASFRAEDGSNTKRRIQGVYTGPAAYATGGDPFLPSDIKLGQIHFIDFAPPSNGSVILSAVYDYVNQKVKWFAAAGTESANAADLSAYTTRFEAIGL